METEDHDNSDYEPSSTPPPAIVATQTSTAPTPRKPRAPAGATFSAGQALGEEGEKNVFAFLKELSSQGVVKIKMYRLEPTTWEGTNIKGWMCDFDRTFEEAEIKERFGGGRFEVVAYQANPKGGWMGGNKRQFGIAGPPKLTGELSGLAPPVQGPVVAQEPVSLASQAMQVLAAQTRAADQRAERAEQRQEERGRDREADSPIYKMMDTQMKGLLDQLSEMRRSLGEKDQKIIELLARPVPKNEFQERLLGNMMDGESARIEAIRTRHESELRVMTENARRDVERERDRAADDFKAKEKQHERELQSLKDSHANTAAANLIANEARVDGLKGRIADLERTLGKSETEVVELRLRKEKTLVDSIHEVSQMRGLLEEMGGGAKEEESSTAERVIGAILQSPVAQAVSDRFRQAPVAAPVAAPAGQQRRRRPNPANQTRRVVVPPPAPSVAADGSVVQTNSPTINIEIDPAELSLAIMYMETAFSNNADPANFAASARTSVPGSILQAIKVLGVDKFMSDIVHLPENSILAGGGGRNWLRKVAKYLIGETPAVEAPSEETLPE